MFRPFFRLAFLLFVASLFCQGNCHPKKKAYRFFVAGHVYGTPGRKAPGLHPPFVNDFDFIRSHSDMRCGIFTGDIVYRSTPAHWDAVDQAVSDLGIPVYFTTGNHDEGHKSPYKDRYGLTYYRFDTEGDLFIVLNPGLGGWNIWAAQMAFLKNTLKEAKKYNNIFVFFHQVLWWSPDNRYKDIQINSTDGRTPEVNFWPEVVPLFQATERPVFFFAGDVGASFQKTPYFYEQYDEQITLIASGMGNGKYDNYVIVQVDADKKVNIDVRWFNPKYQKNL